MRADDSELAQRQRHLVDTIFNNTHLDASTNWHNGLRVYRNNLASTATRALQLTYPVLTQLLGDPILRSLAKQLLQSSSPTTGDWADWGHALTDVIRNSSLAKEHGFLTDICKLEWAIHQAGRSSVRPISLDTLASFNPDALLQATMHLSPGVMLLQSEYPIDHIWYAHQPRADGAHFDADALAAAVREHSDTCHLLVFQHHYRARMIRLSPPEFHWFNGIAKNLTFAQLIDNCPQIDAVDWLHRAVELQWICGLTTLDLRGLNTLN